MSGRPYVIEPLTPAADPRALDDALRLVLRMLPEPTAEVLRLSTLAEARIAPAALGRLFAARDAAGRTLGAVWAQLRPGNVAVVWPSQWLISPAEARDPLLAELLTALASTGVTLVQSLLPDATCADAQTLRSCGFTHLADLAYLGAAATNAEAHGTTFGAGSAAPLESVRYRPADRPRLAALVERTYAGTLDCPALNDLRSADEVLDEYETIGPHGAAEWYFVRRGETDVGCLLLAEHPQQDQVELVYMALLPEARGRGWGEAIARESLRIAAVLGRARVVLAVDAANRPAAELYRRAGFQAWDTRSVFTKSPP